MAYLPYLFTYFFHLEQIEGRTVIVTATLQSALPVLQVTWLRTASENTVSPWRRGGRVCAAWNDRHGPGVSSSMPRRSRDRFLHWKTSHFEARHSAGRPVADGFQPGGAKGALRAVVKPAGCRSRTRDWRLGRCGEGVATGYGPHAMARKRVSTAQTRIATTWRHLGATWTWTGRRVTKQRARTGTVSVFVGISRRGVTILHVLRVSEVRAECDWFPDGRRLRLPLLDAGTLGRAVPGDR